MISLYLIGDIKVGTPWNIPWNCIAWHCKDLAPSSQVGIFKAMHGYLIWRLHSSMEFSGQFRRSPGNPDIIQNSNPAVLLNSMELGYGYWIWRTKSSMEFLSNFLNSLIFPLPCFIEVWKIYNFWLLEDVIVFRKVTSPKICYISSWTLIVELLSGKCQRSNGLVNDNIPYLRDCK